MERRHQIRHGETARRAPTIAGSARRFRGAARSAGRALRRGGGGGGGAGGRGRVGCGPSSTGGGRRSGAQPPASDYTCIRLYTCRIGLYIYIYLHQIIHLPPRALPQASVCARASFAPRARQQPLPAGWRLRTGRRGACRVDDGALRAHGAEVVVEDLRSESVRSRSAANKAQPGAAAAARALGSGAGDAPPCR